MPDLPISALPSLASPEPTDVFAIVNSGITKKTTVQAVGDAVFTQISSSVVLPSQTGSFLTTTVYNSLSSSFVTTSSFNLYTGSVASYYLSAYHTGSISASVTNTPYSTSFSTTDISRGISIGGPIKNRIQFTNQGVYDIQFSAQINKTNSAPATMYIWLAKNGTDVPDSNTGVAVFGGANEAVVASWNFFVSASASDYYELRFGATDNNTFLQYDASPTVGPAVPSIILTVDRVG